MYVGLYVFMKVIFLQLFLNACMLECAQVCVCMCVFVYVWMCLCTYEYMYVYIHSCM